MGVREYELEEDYGRQDRMYDRDRRAYDRDDQGYDRGYDRDDRGYGRDERGYSRDDRGYSRDDRDYGRDDRGYGGQGNRRGYEDDRQEPKKESPSKKESLAKREPVRLAGAVVTLITAGALVLFGIEVTSEQQTQIQELVLLAIPIITPLIAGFEIARSKVDSPATVDRKIREERSREGRYR